MRGVAVEEMRGFLWSCGLRLKALAAAQRSAWIDRRISATKHFVV
jgi:hypothetical protein